MERVKQQVIFQMEVVKARAEKGRDAMADRAEKAMAYAEMLKRKVKEIEKEIEWLASEIRIVTEQDEADVAYPIPTGTTDQYTGITKAKYPKKPYQEGQE